MITWGESLQDTIAEAVAILDRAREELEGLIQRAEDAHRSEALPSGESEAWQALLERLHRLVEHCAADSMYVIDPTTEAYDGESRIQFIQSQEEERQRIAREIQEGPAQLLANAVFELDSCDHLLDDDPALAHEGLRLLQAELRAGLETTQNLIVELQPPLLLSELGLAASLERYLEHFQATTGLEVHAHLEDLTMRLPPTMEVTIFRIIQEALRNVRQHAEATQVSVEVEVRPDTLVFVVEDNGKGFTWTPLDRPIRRRWGLIGMRDRALLLGGRLRIFNKGDGGTRVVLTVPYPVSPAPSSTTEAYTLSVGGESE
ncbi:MAG TPA: sensor histidine kinase [Anaerolineae bacterium]|nr:sensor histidine kinase [Anaerolineae bacterium]